MNVKAFGASFLYWVDFNLNFRSGSSLVGSILSAKSTSTYFYEPYRHKCGSLYSVKVISASCKQANVSNGLIWQYWLSSFQAGGTKSEDFCLTIDIHKGNYWILRIGVMGRCQKVPKSIFYVKIHRNLYQFIFHWRIPI